jgi:4-hydroxy-2-oxoheptanedioate aldolase
LFKNKAKALLQLKQPILNGWLSIGNTLTAEIMSVQGYDTLTIDMQHGALDYADALKMMQAMGASGITPMVRVPWREPGVVMKALDAGAQGIICPMINTAEEAAELVSFTKYPPFGQRSSGPTRAAFAYGGYGLDANDQILTLAMIETVQGLENIEQILAVPGLDGIYVGPSDLTLATQGGRLPPGFDREEPEMKQILEAIPATCRKYGSLAGIHCGSAAYALRAIKWGYGLTTVSGDTRLLASAAAQSIDDWRKGLGDASETSRQQGY